MMKVLTGLLDWTDARFPATKMWKEHLGEYYAPKNFNFWYYFGSLALLVLVLQLVTGIWLAMYYKPDAEGAFRSVEYIMREVPWGWVLRYMHSTGSSFFFIIVYLHMFRALLYGSYKQPRELLWVFGMMIYGALMAEAFFGYLLPWGQMSYWGAQVIISLFGALPIVGEPLAEWIRGDYVVSDATLNRFFSLHVAAIPLVLVGLVGAHILALHEVGSNNPDGVEIKKRKNNHGVPMDGIPFHPYYTVKDLMGAAMFLILFALVVFFAPEFGGWFLEAANFVPADPLKTPEHIRARVVLHALLRDPARHSGQAYRRGGDGRFGGDPVRAAVAGSSSGQVGAVSKHLVQGADHDVCRDLHRTGLSRHAGADERVFRACLPLRSALLLVLPDPVVLQQGSIE